MAFNIDAPVFAPSVESASQGPSEKPVTQLPVKKVVPPKSLRKESQDLPLPQPEPQPKPVEDPAADFGGYQNRHLNSDQIAEQTENQKAEEMKDEATKIYTLEEMMALRN